MYVLLCNIGKISNKLHLIPITLLLLEFRKDFCDEMRIYENN